MSQNTPKTENKSHFPAKGFLGGAGIAAIVAGVAEFFDHAPHKGNLLFPERLQALAKKPALWGGMAVASVVGAALDRKNSQLSEAAEKNSALYQLVQEKDAALAERAAGAEKPYEPKHHDPRPRGRTEHTHHADASPVVAPHDPITKRPGNHVAQAKREDISRSEDTPVIL